MFTHDHETGLSDAVAAKLLQISRYIGLAVFGLLPVLFIPNVYTPIGYTKIIIASVGLFFAVIFFAFSVLRQGSVRLRFELPIALLFLAFAVATISALFSGDFFDSFWGTEISAHSAVFVGILALTTTAWMFIGTNKQTILRLYLLLALSAVVLALFHLCRILFGVDVLSFGIFGGSIVSTPFSEWNSLAIFFGLVIILSLIALEQLMLSAVGRGIFTVVIAFALMMLAIINFEAVFVVLGLVSLVMILYGLTKGRFKASQMIALRPTVSTVSLMASLATLVVSIVFVVGGSTIGGMVSRLTDVSYIEVRPSLQATIGIAKQVYKDNAFLGIGPNRFVDAWRQYRDPSINSTIFWNTNFQAGFGFIPTIFVTHGILGGFTWLTFFGAFLYVGMRTLLRAVPTDPLWYFIALSSFVASIYLWGMSFIYVPGPVLLLLAAVCSGVFLAARQVLMPEAGKKFLLMQNQRAVFLTIATTVLVVVGSVGSVFYMGRYYTATALFVKSVTELQQGGDSGSATARIVRAFELSRDDVFARQLSFYEQGKLQQKVSAALAANALSESDRKELQDHIVNGLESGKTATQIDSSEPENWAVLGRVYATAIPLNIDQAYELAKEALEKARALDPQNPARLVSLAEVELLKRNNANAREYVNRAIALKANYTDAMYVLTQIEVADGNVAAAIESTLATTRLDSKNPVRFFQLGVLQYSANRIPEAATSFEKAIELSPEYSNARYFLAFMYDAMGRQADALKQLEEVLARNLDNTEVQALIGNLKDQNALNPQQQRRDPIQESSENVAGQEPVTQGQAPSSPLLSPVNADTEASPKTDQ